MRLWKWLQPLPPDSDWENYFEEGEVLVWSGAPKPGIRMTAPTVFLSIFGLPFLFAGITVSVGGAMQFLGLRSWVDGGFGFFVFLFGLPFIAVGGALSIGTWVHASQKHNFVRYALSNRRAYIAKSWWRHDLSVYPIYKSSPVHLERDKTYTVRFYKMREYDSDGDLITKEISFEHIADGKEVYALLRKTQGD